jgi:hypothetical protein
MAEVGNGPVSIMGIIGTAPLSGTVPIIVPVRVPDFAGRPWPQAGPAPQALAGTMRRSANTGRPMGSTGLITKIQSVPKPGKHKRATNLSR